MVTANGTARGGAMRRAGNMASMSGADDNVYLEVRKKDKHPLFKKLRAMN